MFVGVGGEGGREKREWKKDYFKELAHTVVKAGSSNLQVDQKWEIHGIVAAQI